MDTSTHERFVHYFQAASQSQETIDRFERLVELISNTMREEGRTGPFQIADIGGGAGTLTRMFARDGHNVTCVDISKDLLEIGKRRAEEEGLETAFINCCATRTPIADASIDICVVPELLEHVVDWQACLDEASRMLKPGGLLYLSTTNKLCPLQDEFNLPLYSWYPGFLKHHYEHLAATTRPDLVTYTKYPAVHWFTFYRLREALLARDFSRFLDRLDMTEILGAGNSKALMAKRLKKIPLSRMAVQFLPGGALILAFKASAQALVQRLGRPNTFNPLPKLFAAFSPLIWLSEIQFGINGYLVGIAPAAI